MILKNRIFIVTILAMLLLNGCGDRAGRGTDGTPIVVDPVDKDGDKYNVDVDPDDNDPCNPNIEAGTCDQDKDGLTNDQENFEFRTKPKNPDTDGDGLSDGTGEVLASTPSDPLNSCDPAQLPKYRGYNNANDMWQKANCDGDDYSNGAEDNISLAPNNYLSDPYNVNSACFMFDGKKYCLVYPIDGRVWLDRNLGADKVCETSMDSGCYGDLYQWGRGTDGHQKRTSLAKNLNPDVFPYSSGAHFEIASKGVFDWLTADSTEETSLSVVDRQDSWKSVTDNSVCPKGWYVPSMIELNNLASKEDISNSATAFGSSMNLPLSGSRSSGASLEEIDNEGYIWSSDTDNTTQRSVAFTYTKNNIGKSTPYRATGYSIRCIKK